MLLVMMTNDATFVEFLTVCVCVCVCVWGSGLWAMILVVDE